MLENIKINEIQPTEAFSREVANLFQEFKLVPNEENVNNIKLLLCFRHQYGMLCKQLCSIITV